eukprot:244838_1
MSVQPEEGMTENIDVGIHTNEGSGTARIYEDAAPYSPASKNTKSTSTRLDGVGNLLYHVHSTHCKSILCAKEETSLQFYEHVVIATAISRLWCFPKSCQVNVIPRFKIVDATFSLGPRKVPLLVWLLLAAALALIITGATFGGCRSCEDEWVDTGSQYDYYGSYESSGYYTSSGCHSSSGTCASLVIGVVLAAILVPILLIIPCIWKWHYVYLDVKTHSPNWFSSGAVTYAYRFKKMGFDHSTDDKAVFDEFYLVDYVYGSFNKGGNDTMSEAHLLSHFHHVSLATPIVPIHADNSVCDIVLPAVGVNHRNKHGRSNQEDAMATAVPGSIHPSFFAPKRIDV